MTSRFNHTSYIIDFLDDMLDTEKVSAAMKTYTDKLVQPLGILQDWELNFWCTYGNKDQIAIYKRGPAIKSEKRKEIVVHIPRPTTDTVPWGVLADKCVNIKLPPNWGKNFLFLDIAPSAFDNIHDYVLSSLKQAVKAIIEFGFTIQGTLVKIQSQI